MAGVSQGWGKRLLDETDLQGQLFKTAQRTLGLVEVDIILHYTTYNNQRIVMLDNITPDDILTEGHQKELGIIYGGHKDAIGISRLDNLPLFQKLISEHISEMKRKEEDIQLLDISFEELSKQETFEKIMKLEPTGEGLKIPPVKVDGKMTKRTKGGVSSWATLTFKDGKNQLYVNDWNYDEQSYPKRADGKTSAIAKIEISNFRGLHLDLESIFNRSEMYQKQQEAQKNVPSLTH